MSAPDELTAIRARAASDAILGESAASVLGGPWLVTTIADRATLLRLLDHEADGHTTTALALMRVTGERDEARAERDAANIRLREMGSREEDMEDEISRLRGTEARLNRERVDALLRATQAEAAERSTEEDLCAENAAHLAARLRATQAETEARTMREWAERAATAENANAAELERAKGEIGRLQEALASLARFITDDDLRAQALAAMHPNPTPKAVE